MSIFYSLGLGGLFGYGVNLGHEHYLYGNPQNYINNQQDYRYRLNQYLYEKNNQENKKTKDYIDVEFEVIDQKLICEVK